MAARASRNRMWSAPLRSVMWRKPSSMSVARSDIAGTSKRVERRARDRCLGGAETRVHRQGPAEIRSREGRVAERAFDHAGVIEQLCVLGVLRQSVLDRRACRAVMPLFVECPRQKVVSVDVATRAHLDAGFGEHAIDVAPAPMVEQEKTPGAMNGPGLLESA